MVRRTRRGATLPPDKVPRGLHKEYMRMPRIKLPEPEPLSDTLDAVIGKRASCRVGSFQETFSIGELGTLLGHALRVRDDGRRNYPSGGALFPIETYLVGNVLEGYAPGVFHYHPTAHALEFLWELPPDFDMENVLRSPNPRAPFSSALIVFTSVWDRASAKYGDFSYIIGLLEAGHMSQNVLLVSASLDLCTCPMAGFNDELLTNLLDIDEGYEQPVHTITLCRKGASDVDASDGEEA
ncbi:hypothetical protein A3A39_03465 [Candidatus Kaiserbacteria bacterium RIFCSPLOWO2_01_FULL_54_13]|uniref:Nitroreductase domain-containing protein n=1 Tax=Candidatus Kaiserbacteria bacterium RIFCSPLOWO2_01_FULL_54_13 TaxID=1798512 RepID=A0A1F6F391_9BACT|nr:MAG: hypothetical protein A3A39_03465 [Candidatus Kaiserbacteria bacterium RIFCSPLOWO2_01_FULL_54_13]